MYRRNLLVIPLLLGGLLALNLLLPAAAAPSLQLTPFLTPTPGPDGRIMYVVQPEDTIWRIAAISGISREELRLLNNLGPDDILIPGQQLLLGFGGPLEVVPTPGPTVTPTPLLPTPGVQPGGGSICVLLYEDLNGDAFRQDTEVAVAGGAISISERSGAASLTGTTTAQVDEDGEPLRDCFEDLPEGRYSISLAIPEAYNPTTELDYLLDLQAGDETLLDFGAQLSSQAVSEAPLPEEGGLSPMLGVVGILFLLGGVGLGLFAGRLRRRPTF